MLAPVIANIIIMMEEEVVSGVIARPATTKDDNGENGEKDSEGCN